MRFWTVKALLHANPMVLFIGIAALRALPAGARRADRQGGHDPLHARAGVHRPAHGRRRHGDPQGLVLPCYRAHAGVSRPARSPSAGTSSSARRPCSTSTPRWATGRSSAIRPRCNAARRSRPASAGTGRRPQRTDVDYVRSRRPTAAPSRAGRATPPAAADRCSGLTCRWGSEACTCCSPRCRRCARSWTRRRSARRRPSVLPRRAGPLVGAVLRLRRRGPRGPVHGPAAAQPDGQAGHGLPAVRLPLLGAPGDRAHRPTSSSSSGCSATAPTSSTTCAASATTCPRSSRPGRTSARR